ncbi:carbon monoxide dehydrogenase subunit G [Acuticoccus sp. M5D2P5]|uniref:SRPBCC family protein n=1 Tax=Acuticoccus kalidii TaxID=2910977 RepID=UPI001F15B97C|nr:carbon monoxide dehydrogenase subunit G [Acuticoccus kalidii]MCF3936080.1 carbon monoxide dehydrogenase subunit G [Acuticoccus kalidii]
MIETPLRAGREEPTMPDGRGYRMRGAGSTVVAISPQALWEIVMDEQRLAAAIPGAETLHRADRDEIRVYAADVGIGVGKIKGTYRVSAAFAETIAPSSLVLFGGAEGPFGNSTGEGWVDFRPVEGGTEVSYAYAILISGFVARVGGRLLDAAANTLIDKFFARLAKAAATV